jgi:hypothetical protein
MRGSEKIDTNEGGRKAEKRTWNKMPGISPKVDRGPDRKQKAESCGFVAAGQSHLQNAVASKFRAS